MYRALLHALIRSCREARQSGVSAAEVRRDYLPKLLATRLPHGQAQAFLNWVKDDREYAFFYYEVQQMGACAKPAEAVALILEAIVLEENE